MVWLTNAARLLPRHARGMASTAWKPPVSKGTMPVYDEVLAFLERDAAEQRARWEDAKAAQGDAASPDQLDALEISSEINLPAIRSQFTQGEYDLSRPVFRHLREQAWRQGGALDRLAERVTLMHILPDVVPDITFSADVQVLFGTGNGIGDHGGTGGDVLPGIFLPPSQTLDAPQIRATVFHPEERKYTLALVDPDAPHEDSESFHTYLHWLVADIPLSAHASSLPASVSATLPYIPPHPQQGTPYHRYTLLLLEQTGPVSFGSVSREGFNAAQFAKEHSLALRGMHFWRAKWSKDERDTVASIYKNTLETHEPRYGRAPRQDKLKDTLGNRHSKYY